MAKSKRRTKHPSLSEMTPEQLKALGSDALVGIVQQLWEQNQQLSEMLRQVVQRLNPPKTERFENPEQLRLFEALQSECAENVEEEDASANQHPKKRSKKKGHQRNPMPAHLDRRSITGAEPQDCDLTCKK